MAQLLAPDGWSDDSLERRLYARDMAFLPSWLIHPFVQTVPEAILRPSCPEQVSEILRQATRQRTPVTPRAAATTALYNTVPARGGWLLDLNGLCGRLEVDTARQVVRVPAATTWAKLDGVLASEGLAVKSYPSSAIAATVGGWVSMQGHGIGSLKYGGVSGQLLRLRVVLPGGETIIATQDSDPPLEWFAQAEGTLGVITDVDISVRPRPTAEAHHLFAMDDPGALGDSVRDLARAEPRPFTIFFADGGYQRLLARSRVRPPPGSIPSSLSANSQGLLLASYQGEPDEVRQGSAALVHLPGRQMSSEQALEEWDLRLYHLGTRRAGPSLVGAEMWLPLDGLGRYLAQVRALADRHHKLIGTYGFAVASDWALTLSLVPTDEGAPAKYLPALAFTHWLQKLGASCGGRPYGAGMFNAAYLRRLFSHDRLAELRRRKARLDPLGIMNPGKLYRPVFPFTPALFATGASLLGAAHLVLGR